MLIDGVPAYETVTLEYYLDMIPVDAIRKIRDLDLKKKPCISETLDWAQSLIALQVEDLSADVVRETLSVICKYRADVAQVKEKIEKIVK